MKWGTCFGQFTSGIVTDPFQNVIYHHLSNGLKVFPIPQSKYFLPVVQEKIVVRSQKMPTLLMARLPEPEEEEPIEAQNLRTSGIIVTQSEWDAWCQPPSDVDQSLQNQFDIVNQLRSTINENGVRIPKTPLREIMHYLRLSQSIKMAPTRALDWALTMRLLPWIEKQPNIIDSVLSGISQEYDDLEHFNEALQIAHEKINETN